MNPNFLYDFLSKIIQDLVNTSNAQQQGKIITCILVFWMIAWLTAIDQNMIISFSRFSPWESKTFVLDIPAELLDLMTILYTMYRDQETYSCTATNCTATAMFCGVWPVGHQLKLILRAVQTYSTLLCHTEIVSILLET